MIIEVLFSEACALHGDRQNAAYLQACLPNEEFIFTQLHDTPYFANARPDMILIGSMSEAMQRTVIAKLLPLKARLMELIESGVPILATGNAGEVFCRHISYITEKMETDGLGIFDLDVKTNLFDRYNGKVLCQFEDMEVVGFRSQFSFIFGDNTHCHFGKVERGIGINRESKLEGLRKHNLLCTHLLGPILPLNPLLCEHLIKLAGGNAPAAFRDAAMDAYQQHLTEFHDPNVVF